MKHLASIGTLALMIASATPGFSQGLRLTGYGSASFMNAERTFVVDGDSYRSDFDNGGRFGVRAAFDITDSWAIEASVGIGKNTFSIVELDDSSFQPRPYDVNLQEWSGHVRYYFTSTENRIRPFVTVGTGITVMSPTDEAREAALGNDFIDDPVALDSSNQLTVNFGTGVEARLIRGLGVRFDLRNHMMTVPRFGLPETSSGPGGIFFPVSGAMHNVEASAGVIIYIF